MRGPGGAKLRRTLDSGSSCRCVRSGRASWGCWCMPSGCTGLLGSRVQQRGTGRAKLRRARPHSGRVSGSKKGCSSLRRTRSHPKSVFLKHNSSNSGCHQRCHRPVADTSIGPMEHERRGKTSAQGLSRGTRTGEYMPPMRYGVQGGRLQDLQEVRGGTAPPTVLLRDQPRRQFIVLQEVRQET